MTHSPERHIELITLAQLTPAARNPRTHSDKQLGQIAQSIKRFGFTNPILIDDDDHIVAGHGRAAAAKLLNLVSVPCVRLGGMSAAEKRAYIIADNKLALNAGWDMEILAGELGELIAMDFDTTLTGFEHYEVDVILVDQEEATTTATGPEDVHPEPGAAAEAVTRPDDLWCLGHHRLLCADAKDPAAVDRLMAGGKADMVFADPPYNVRIAGHVSGLGQTRHREFVQASGEMTFGEFTAFLTLSFEAMEHACRDGAILYICMDWRHLREVLAAGFASFNELKNICVWKKTNAGMGSFYRSQHEMILVWKIGDTPHTNNFGLGDKGRYRTNVWNYPGVNSFGADRMAELSSHPTVKPVALVADAIRDVSNRGDTVLDSFGGSGTTLIAAEKVGRVARLMEIDPVYCDVTIQRWEMLTGKRARLEATGQTFETVRLSRADPIVHAGQEAVA